VGARPERRRVYEWLAVAKGRCPCQQSHAAELGEASPMLHRRPLDSGVHVALRFPLQAILFMTVRTRPGQTETASGKCERVDSDRGCRPVPLSQPLDELSSRRGAVGGTARSAFGCDEARRFGLPGAEPDGEVWVP
jgi:hypothetical protein